MTLGHNPPPSRPERDATPDVPPTDRGKMALAGALLMVPIVALMWVPSYAKIDPELFGFPFFFWYQFLWVFLCSALTYTAYRLTLAARPPRTPGATSTTDRTDGPDVTDGSGGSHTPDGDR